MMTWRRRAGLGLLLVAAGVAPVLLTLLAREQREGPPHQDLVIGHGIPATFYAPQHANASPVGFPDPPTPNARWAVIVLAHSFGADRSTMSSIARRFAESGYAVIAFDFRGHGNNPNGFRSGELTADLADVVEWADSSPYIDPHRIALVGHSMGATAVLQFASEDPRPSAVVAISGAQRVGDGVDIGGNIVDGPHRPPNVLFLWASEDPPFIRDESAHLASRLAHQPIQLDQPYGDIASRTAVRAHVLGGLNHGTELFSGKTAAQTVTWLNQAFGIAARSPAGLSDPRIGTAGLYLLCALVLTVGLGVAAARLSPSAASIPAPPWHGLALVALALGAAIPWAGPTAAAASVSLSAVDSTINQLAVAGGLLTLAIALGRRSHTRPRWCPPPIDRMDVRHAIAPAAILTLGIFSLLVPVGDVFHRLAPTAARLPSMLIALLLLTPFFVCFHRIARGGATRAAIRGIAGHAIILTTIGAAPALGFVPGVAGLLAPALMLIIFIFTELAASSFYRLGGTPIAIGLAEAALVGWVLCVTAPIS